ncbi:6-phosphogluconate dehydrogenase, decarboxylating [Toxocara canis]|uniref:6-phosphogluconate dehydrogenase, decarboxylating n=2 Tax=Toxocara canis TaxID=6265 RepID=A0A0B2VGY3_TOXCA|nr:6-phosphogluconate dehydrogenase, decarboxylating [Toxocara canis]
MSNEAVADIAVVGLAVMGQNLILNMNDKGFVVCAFNRTVSKVDDFLANEAKGTKIVGAHSLEEMAKYVCAFNRTVSKVDDFLANEAKGTKIVGAHSLEEMAKKLKRPRRVLLLVKAGSAVDSMIEKMLPYLEKGDIIIDAGNSEYTDTNRRFKELGEKGFLFVGSGISGGEEGARHGPSMMPGGAQEAWPHIKDIFQKVSAKVGSDSCCDWVFDDWNKGELDSYLIQITAEILRFKDDRGQPLVPQIRDTAGQKGTGKWTGIAALTYGIPVTLIGEAVFARCLSSLKSDRITASNVLMGPRTKPEEYVKDKKEFIEHIRRALYASKIVSYAQGFMLMAEASRHYDWKLNFGAIALMWRGGCIIRSRFLGDIKRAFDENPKLTNLLLDKFFTDAVHQCQDSWRKVCATSVMLGIPTPAFSTALAFYDGYRHEVLPASLIQAQRDYFGAHTYELMTNPGVFVHTNWTGTGGRVASSTYTA